MIRIHTGKLNLTSDLARERFARLFCSGVVDNGSSATMEGESSLNEVSDLSVNRSLVNRRGSKKTLLPHPGSSTKRKGIVRSHSQTYSSILSSKSTSSSSISLSSSSHSSSIVKPSHIELPHSLVDVVINWNLPMHYWLKIYVYIPTKKHYGHFPSVLLTYLASALLHGFNFQLSIVLFSIGLFAYVEYGFRRKLARILDACVAARACPLRSSCDEHTYTYWHPLTMIVNVFLCLLSLWHLTYLGQLFDGSSQETIGYSWQHVLEKWAKLNFASHLVVIGTYAIFRSLWISFGCLVSCCVAIFNNLRNSLSLLFLSLCVFVSRSVLVKEKKACVNVAWTKKWKEHSWFFIDNKDAGENSLSSLSDHCRRAMKWDLAR